MPNQCERLIVIGTSAGAVEALSSLVALLPSDLPAAVAIVYHQSPTGNSYMPAILKRHSQMPVDFANDGEAITCGHIYLARADHHLLVKPGHFRLTRGPRENSSRPAVDPLFRTAAQVFGGSAVGVVLTGNLDDGTSGLSTIKTFGGVAIAQDPTDAPYPGMPRSAIENVDVDYILPLSEIARVLVRVVTDPLPAFDVRSGVTSEYYDPAEGDPTALPDEYTKTHKPSAYTCPECHGTLWEVSRPGEPLSFRCRVGHAFSADHLAYEQGEKIDEALWIALRALEERAALSDRLVERAVGQKQALSADRFAQQAKELRMRANTLRKVLKQGRVEAVDPEQPPGEVQQL